jgi:hypothetical protein
MRRNNPEDSRLHTRRRENLKSHLVLLSLPPYRRRVITYYHSLGKQKREICVRMKLEVIARKTT